MVSLEIYPEGEWRKLTATAVNSHEIYENVFVITEWRGWVKTATAIKPAVYDLPLAAGWFGGAIYYKTQENLCIVTFNSNKVSQLSHGELIATLPEGYRPGSPSHYPIATYAPHGAAVVSVDTLGRITMGDISAQPDIRYIYGNIIFLAS